MDQSMLGQGKKGKADMKDKGKNGKGSRDGKDDKDDKKKQGQERLKAKAKTKPKQLGTSRATASLANMGSHEEGLLVEPNHQGREGHCIPGNREHSSQSTRLHDHWNAATI